MDHGCKLKNVLFHVHALVDTGDIQCIGDFCRKLTFSMGSWFEYKRNLIVWDQTEDKGWKTKTATCQNDATAGSWKGNCST